MIKLSSLKQGDKFKFRLPAVYVIQKQKDNETYYRHFITDFPDKAQFKIKSDTLVTPVN